MAVKPKIEVQGYDIPNEAVFQVAEDFHNAAKMLFRGSGLPPLMLLFFNVGGYALEAYLKSLNAKWDYADPLSQSPIEKYRRTVYPAAKGHDLIKLFSFINESIKKELSE